MIPLRDDNPTRSTPVVNVALIALCVIVFLWELMLPQGEAERAVYLLGFIPAVFFGRADLAQHWVAPELSIVTSMFMHGGWMHLLGNMLYLWIFGDNIEKVMGAGRFLVFYLVCGLAASFAHIAFGGGSTVPAVGASGAISGVLGAYLVLFPRNQVRVLTRGGIMSVPAIVVLGFWILIQMISGLGSLTATSETAGGGVAYMAHIGGFVAGLVLAKIMTGWRERAIA